jgi:hypothetical protein
MRVRWVRNRARRGPGRGFIATGHQEPMKRKIAPYKQLIHSSGASVLSGTGLLHTVWQAAREARYAAQAPWRVHSDPIGRALNHDQTK